MNFDWSQRFAWLRAHGSEAVFGVILTGILINLAILLWPTPPLVVRLAPHPLSLSKRLATMPVLVEAQTIEPTAMMAWVDPASPEKAVPVKAKHPKHHTHSKADKMTSGTLNLNTASQAQLQRLPGVGPKMAQRILAYRKSHGVFTAVDQLNEIQGIGDKKLAKMRPFCKV